MVLNAGSRVKYNKNKWSSRREVRLDGEAYFNVEKGPPFVVLTDQGSVEVLGTSFNLKSRGNTLVVECFEGKVLVLADNTRHQLEANNGIQIRDVNPVEIYQLSSNLAPWLNGRSGFRNIPVEEVFSELERQYNIEVLSDRFDLNFSGTFSNNNLSEAVKEIAQPLRLQSSISPDGKKVTFTR